LSFQGFLRYIFKHDDYWQSDFNSFQRCRYRGCSAASCPFPSVTTALSTALCGQVIMIPGGGKSRSRNPKEFLIQLK